MANEMIFDRALVEGDSQQSVGDEMIEAAHDDAERQRRYPFRLDSYQSGSDRVLRRGADRTTEPGEAQH